MLRLVGLDGAVADHDQPTVLAMEGAICERLETIG